MVEQRREERKASVEGNRTADSALMRLTDDMLKYKPESDINFYWFHLDDADSSSILARIQDSTLRRFLHKDVVSENVSNLQRGVGIELFAQEFPMYERDPKDTDNFLETGTFKGRMVTLQFRYLNEQLGEENQRITLSNVEGGNRLTMTGVNYHDDADYDDYKARRTERSRKLSEEESLEFLSMMKELFEAWKKEDPLRALVI